MCTYYYYTLHNKGLVVVLLWLLYFLIVFKYSPNTFAFCGFTMWITAGISSITTDTFAAAEFFPREGIPGKQSKIWDFVPNLSLPLLKREGGYLEFSYLKNSFVFEPGRACKETNICVTIAVEDLYDPILSAPFSNFAGGGLRNVYRFG